MMKNWKKIAILLVVLVVFVAAFIFLSNLKEDPGASGNSADPSPSAAATDTPVNIDEVDLVDIPRDDITKIILKRNGEDIVLSLVEKEIEKLNQKEDGTVQKIKEKAKVWVAPDFNVDSSSVEDIALAGDTVVTKRLIEENPKDITIYGLDKALKVTFVSSGGKEITLEVGDVTPLKDSYYVRKSGSNAVYTIDSYKGENLISGKLDIVSKTLYHSEALTVDELLSLSFTRGGEKIFDSQQNAADKEWKITWPFSKKVNTSEFFKFIQWVAGAKASGVEAENPGDLKAYGLDKPGYVFDFELGGRSYSLKVGSKKDSAYYAMIEGNPLVYTLSATDLSFIDLRLIDVVEAFVYIPSIYDVEKMVVEIDGRVDESLIKASNDGSEEEEFKVNGKAVDKEDISLFKKYYQGAIGIRGDKIDLEAKPAGNAEIRITYTLKQAGADGKVVTVELIPTNDGYGYYLMKNGQYSGMMVGSRQLNNEEDDASIRLAYKNLIEGMSKTPNQ